MVKKFISLLGVVACVAFCSSPGFAREYEVSDELIVADFEGWPANTGGEIGVYGSLEPNWVEKATVPYSWVYEQSTPGYIVENVHSANQSFRLVTGLGSKPSESWGSFRINMGPALDLTTTPQTVESKDVSGYKYLIFWVKGENGGEKLEVLFRDGNALNYIPQVKIKVPDATTEWQKVGIPLSEISMCIDLTRLASIGIGFGSDVGNVKGATIYIDDFVLANTK